MRYLAILLIGLNTGCYSTTKEIVSRQAARSDAFVGKMNAGGTTRQQEQDFIKANRRAWAAENFDLNGVALPSDIAASTSTDKVSLVNSGGK